MGLLFNLAGSPLASGRAARILATALPAGTTSAAGSFTGPYPSAIAGLSGWWDAGLLSGLRDANGAPLTASNAVVGSLADQSGNGLALAPFHIAADVTPAPTIATPRVNGYLGAAGAPDATVLTYGPTLDPDWGLTHSGFELGSAAAWTRYLVWTRPNWRQGTYYVDADPIPLLHCTATGTTLLQADGPNGTTLKLFPGTASETVLTGALTRRHSHAVILRNTPGAGMDVWLDGAQVAQAVSNPAPASADAQVLYLHDGSIQGSAQC